MNPGEEDSVLLPIDLVIDEIFARLPAKSVAKFHCVSKLCTSMLLRPRFRDLFVARSSSHPRLLLALERANDELLFFSSPLPQNPHGTSSSSLVLPADFYMKFRREMWPCFRGFASGLIYFSSMRNLQQKNDTAPVVYNPLTRQHVSLPELLRYRKSYSFLGFDPVENQFKALFVAYPWCSDDHRILTVGHERWEEVKCDVVHNPLCEGICINGVVYYLAEVEGEAVEVADDADSDAGTSYVLVCFDVRTERFKFVDAGCFSDPRVTTLVNCKGRLGGIDLTYDESDAIVLHLCVLEDGEKQEWSSYVYTLPENKVVDDLSNVIVVGMTATGVIVLAEKFTCKPFHVFYFCPERNTVQTVEVRGAGGYQEAFETECRVYAFVDYVEDYKSITSRV